MSSKKIKHEFNEYVKAFCELFGTNRQTDSEQINNIGLKLFGNEWGGCLPEDSKIKFNSDKSYYVFNNDKSDQPGRHWIAVYVHHPSKTVYIFDTFNRQSSKILPNVAIDIRKNHFKVRKGEDDIVQTDEQENCGQRSLSWLCLVKKYGIDVVKNKL